MVKLLHAKHVKNPLTRWSVWQAQEVYKRLFVVLWWIKERIQERCVSSLEAHTGQRTMWSFFWMLPTQHSISGWKVGWNTCTMGEYYLAWIVNLGNHGHCLVFLPAGLGTRQTMMWSGKTTGFCGQRKTRMKNPGKQSTYLKAEVGIFHKEVHFYLLIMVTR